MPLEGLAQESSGGSQIALLAESEFARVVMAVNDSVEIHPASSDLEERFTDMTFPGDASPA